MMNVFMLTLRRKQVIDSSSVAHAVKEESEERTQEMTHHRLEIKPATFDLNRFRPTPKRSSRILKQEDHVPVLQRSF